MSNMGFGEFCWNELATPNLEAAKKFYQQVLGWQFTDHQIGDMTYTMIKAGDKEFGGIWQIPTELKDEMPPHWMGYILVKNLEDTLKKSEQAGATIKMPVTKAGDFGVFAVVVDPTGAHIAFWQSIESC